MNDVSATPCCLSFENLLLSNLQIHELGNPKTKKPDDVPMFYEVGLGRPGGEHR